MTFPALARVSWPDARRIVSTRFPAIDLFEDIADPADWELLIALSAATNPRPAASVGRLDLVPAPRRVSGAGASLLMAPFTHVSEDRPGRFHDGHFGALYLARTLETALRETTHHKARFLRASREAPGWFTQMRELILALDCDLHDIRNDPAWAHCLDAFDYAPSNTFARSLRASGSDGVVYPSVRHAGGECAALFRPDTVSVPVQARHLGYHFDGVRIDLVRDETTRAVWRI